MPAAFETSVNVPLPLLRNSRSAIPSNIVGWQYIRYPVFRQAAVGVVVEAVVEVIDDVEVEVAVAIEVEEAGAGAPLGGPPATPAAEVTSVKVPSPLFR